MNDIDLSPHRAEMSDSTTNGYLLSAAPLPLAAIDAQGWSLFGDLIGCGMSHLCTALHKRRVLISVDRAYRVTGAIRTEF
jgi:hypothetical protein